MKDDLEVSKKRETEEIELDKQERLAKIELEKQERLAEIDMKAFRDKIQSLSPELYAKLESDKAWSEALKSKDTRREELPSTECR